MAEQRSRGKTRALPSGRKGSVRQCGMSLGKLGIAVVACAFTASVARTTMAQPCAGDCSGDERVTVGEILTCVNIALGTQPASTCLECDANDDGLVTVDEIIRAVGFALTTCPAANPSSTPSPTPTTTSGECPTPRRGSIIVFENLEVNDASNPVVELINTSHILAVASCFYADASPRCGGSGVPCTGSAECAGDTCEPTCGVTGFTVRLPMLSTLSWQPRLGGMDDLGGPIPAIASVPFQGELVCVEVDASGFPFGGNHLAGSTDQTSQCPVVATSIAGLDTENSDAVLCLDGDPSDQCPYGAEYGGCPAGVDPIRVEGCWSHSAFTFDCGPSVTAPTSTPTRTPPPGSTPTPTACPQAVRASIVVFEQLHVGGADDPVVQLASASNALVYADCFYADMAEPSCALTEFSVTITQRGTATWQPRLGGTDTLGNPIPAVPALPFQGELVCVQVGSSGTPFPGNALSGAVTSTGACAIVATGISGFVDVVSDDGVLCLGGSVSAQCPNGAEYESCPTGLDPSRVEGCWSQSNLAFVCE
jgi:hypothetical protein